MFLCGRNQPATDSTHFAIVIHADVLLIGTLLRCTASGIAPPPTRHDAGARAYANRGPSPRHAPVTVPRRVAWPSTSG